MISLFLYGYYQINGSFPQSKIVVLPSTNYDFVNDLRLAVNVGRSLNVGNGSISGRVLENGLPVIRRVMLYERYSGQLVDITWSDSQGNYRFSKINENLTYFIISLDEDVDSEQYNLVGQDLIKGNYDELVASGDL